MIIPESFICTSEISSSFSFNPVYGVKRFKCGRDKSRVQTGMENHIRTDIPKTDLLIGENERLEPAYDLNMDRESPQACQNPDIFS